LPCFEKVGFAKIRFFGDDKTKSSERTQLLQLAQASNPGLRLFHLDNAVREQFKT
jgi:hypothetical protein